MPGAVMAQSRKGRGKPINRERWPSSGPRFDWLSYCDRLHRANGMPSQRAMATAMHLSQPGRVGAILRGEAWPADEIQARALLEALGAAGSEQDRGLRLYTLARAHAVPEAPEWWRSSGYVAQLRDMAPLELYDREPELAELTRWCTDGDDRYVWWQAEARAGKSALMAWFALRPPGRTWIISFFVTGRYAGHADNTAFTSELLDQLSVMTGEQLPVLASPPARDRLRRQLLTAAAQRASQAGCQLVLLVDGLDEDRGAAPGTGLPSIASCLPKHLPAGLRVVVAARPDPPIPPDVDPDHPLRTCRIRRLDPSPHAALITAQAQRELDEALAFRDRLGYEVLALTTAGGGGLGHRDLQQLTGRPAFEIDHLLSGVFGRTIAGRADAYSGDRIVAFTHETLLAEAMGRLGPDTLAGFRTRIHSWAETYRRRGWPQDTPPYLLRGYANMLAETGNLDRLVALATDTARQKRLLDMTGGDAIGLADIAAAFSQLLARDTPDLVAAARLSWHLERLTERNFDLPESLPAVWARIGQPHRAEALARSVDPTRRARVLASLAYAFADNGDTDQAHRCARSLPEADERDDVLARLAVSATSGREHEFASAVLRSIADEVRRQQALSSCAAEAARSGDLARAEAITATITDPGWLPPALAAQAEAAAGHKNFDRAESAAYAITEPGWQATAWAYVADALIDADQVGPASRAVENAVEAARSIPEPDRKAVAMAGLVTRMALTKGVSDAVDLATSVPENGLQAWALCEIAGLAGVAGRDRTAAMLDRAEAVARASADPGERATALVSVAQAMAALGREDRAAALIETVVDDAGTLSDTGTMLEHLRMIAEAGYPERAEAAADSLDPFARDYALERTVATVWAARDHEKAIAVAHSINSEFSRNHALLAVAESAAAQGDHHRAVQIADSMTLAGERAAALTAVAYSAAESGDSDRARELALLVEQIVRSRHDPSREAHRISELIAAAFKIRQHERAAALAGQAETLINQVTGPGSLAYAWTKLLTTVAASGPHDRINGLVDAAQVAADAITDREERAAAFAELAEAVMMIGGLDRAYAVIESITDEHRRFPALINLAGSPSTPGTPKGRTTHLPKPRRPRSSARASGRCRSCSANR
ncbi:hypothetical protein [Actinoplanes sp. NPDC048796]|uniref:hypothetical protein n=1 Tax=unclassified Actinoplanes TaxID=2626549 RepID=UPI0033FDA06B